jgi:hypothetical protein
MGSQDGAHMLTSNINGDWSGLGTFTDVLTAEFCPAESVGVSDRCHWCGMGTPAARSLASTSAFSRAQVV